MVRIAASTFGAVVLVSAVGAPAASQEAPIQETRGFEAPVRIAQGFREVYVDEYGRRVVLDAQGRVIAVEEPRRAPPPSGGQFFDAPPPPGVSVEGRVENPREFYDQPRSADPYAEGGYEDYRERPVERAPLDGSAVQEASRGEFGPSQDGLPGSEIDLPDPDRSIVRGGPMGGRDASSGGFEAGETIRETNPAPEVAPPNGSQDRAKIAALQILLDRVGMSPGVIDGRMGSNVDKAVAAYEEKFGRKLDTRNSALLAEELDRTGGPPIKTYEITADDVAGPYVASIPSDYGEKARMSELSYTSTLEKLAETFHMDENYLKAINPGADFSRQGTRIKVAATGRNENADKGNVVARIIADKGREQVRAYGEDGSLIAAYPATIGSSDTPSPTGTVQVNRIAFDPNYTYNPDVNFRQGDNNKVLTIPPGPNGPVGSIWIALSKPTYGIHGTPEPALIGKTNSHGCVRLTNWDATEIAKMVKPGVTVVFQE